MHIINYEIIFRVIIFLFLLLLHFELRLLRIHSFSFHVASVVSVLLMHFTPFICHFRCIGRIVQAIGVCVSLVSECELVVA